MTPNDGRRAKVVVAGLLLGVAILVPWLWSVRQAPSIAGRATAVGDGGATAPAAPLDTVQREHTALPASQPVVPVTAVAVPRCVEQPLKATIAGRAEPQCFGTSSSLQSGSVVAYRFESRAPGARWLIVEAAGREVVSVSIGQGAAAQFACDSAECSGVQVGAADLYGVRTLSFRGLQLPSVHASAAHPAVERAIATTVATTTAALDGDLLTTADDGAGANASASAACAGQSVIVSTSAGAASRFCPSEGIAMRSNDDGGRTYRFADAESAGIAIEFDEAMHLRRIEYGAMSCAAPACAGVELGGSAGALPTSVRFVGTMVQGDKPVAAWGTLVGQLSLPAW